MKMRTLRTTDRKKTKIDTAAQVRNRKVLNAAAGSRKLIQNAVDTMGDAPNTEANTTVIARLRDAIRAIDLATGAIQ